MLKKCPSGKENVTSRYFFPPYLWWYSAQINDSSFAGLRNLNKRLFPFNQLGTEGYASCFCSASGNGIEAGNGGLEVTLEDVANA